MTTFSERMTAARKDKKLTQDQVAQALDVSRQLVSHWENGRVEPTQEQREAICKLLDIPMDAPKPTPLHKRILAAAALIAFVAILVMAVYPIYKSRRAGTTAEAAVQETQAPQGERYSWEWFQQPDAQPHPFHEQGSRAVLPRLPEFHGRGSPAGPGLLAAARSGRQDHRPVRAGLCTG